MAIILSWICHQRVVAATTVVDWLNLASGSTSTSFSLTSDNGLSAAQGAIAVQTGKGVSYPGFPTLTELNAGYWSGETGFRDSVTGTDRVRTFDIRVAPQGGVAAYSVTLNVPAGQELIIAMGGLFRSSQGGTKSIITTASGGGVVSFVQSLAWDTGGGTAFDQELEWDAPSGTLSTTTGSDGDSEVAFLRVSPLSGPNPQLMFMVPEGYGMGSGESISIGVGMVVPEPGIFALVGMGGLIVLAGRRR